MLYINGHFIYGTREIRYAETLINQKNDTICEILTQFTNWPDTCDFDVNVELIEGSSINMNEDEYFFKIYGPIKDMLMFIYKYVLHYNDCSIENILSDKKELDMIMDVYLQKLW